MAMNIKSISELSSFSEVKGLYSPLLCNESSASLTDALKGAINSWTNGSGEISSIGFNTISCAPDTYIEVASKSSTDSPYTSYKLNLSELLDNINKTLAWVAWVQTNGITKAEASSLFVPYEGNIGKNKPVSGLYIVTPDAGTALCVEGPVMFSNNNQLNFETKEGGCYISTLNASKAVVQELTGNDINVLSTFVVGPVNNYVVSANSELMNARQLSVANLTAEKLTAGTNDWQIVADATGTRASKLSIGNLLGDEGHIASLTAENLFAGGSVNFALCAFSTPVGEYYVKTKALSAEALNTPQFTASKIIATDELYAGKIDGDEGYYVKASNIGTITGLSATKIRTPQLEIEKLSVLSNMYVGKGQADNEWNINASNSRCDVNQLSAKGLSADGIAQLTAKAACWS